MFENSPMQNMWKIKHQKKLEHAWREVTQMIKLS